MGMMKYRVRYTRKTESGTVDCVEDVLAVDLGAALRDFHRTMQLHKVIADDRRTILREQLSPNDYKVSKISLMYNSDPSGKLRGDWIESNFDLPPNPTNPDLRAAYGMKEETPTMQFMDSIQEGKLAD